MLGVDIVYIPRIADILERFNFAFIQKILTEREQNRKITPEYLAGRWACKEAIAKALGNGFGSDLRILDIQILNGESGKPFVVLYGQNREDIHVSISHDKDYAIAIAKLTKSNY